MAVSDEDTSLMDEGEEDRGNATETSNFGSGRAWQARPNRGRNDDCKPNYHGERHKRTDLRTTDGHYSWRQVYRLLEASGGGRP